MENVQPVQVLEIHEDYDLVKITPIGGLGKISTVSAQEMERDDVSVTLRLREMDAIMVRGLIMYLWDQEEHCFYIP